MFATAQHKKAQQNANPKPLSTATVDSGGGGGVTIPTTATNKSDNHQAKSRSSVVEFLFGEDKVIEHCTKDEYSLFGSTLRSNRDSNGEYESFVQSSTTIPVVQMLFLSRAAENRDRKHHPCDSNMD